jgi:hypothetical protein
MRFGVGEMNDASKANRINTIASGSRSRLRQTLNFDLMMLHAICKSILCPS